MNVRRLAMLAAGGGLLAGLTVTAQEPGHGGWRRADDPPVVDQNAPPPPAPAQANAPEQNPPQQNYDIPPSLTIKPGTFLTVRIDQGLSSDRNQPGDAFSGTLVKPIVVDGIVVAQPGETVGGRVTEAQKAGVVKGVSRLGVQLTDLTLVDGDPVSVQSQMVNRSGPTSVGRDAAAIGGTTAMGAAIGAAAGWGTGAAWGAGAGAALGTIGVLLTRGHATVIYPESVLTFRIEQPVTISTERAPQAFRYVQPDEYDRPAYAYQPQPRPQPQPRYGYGYAYGYPPPPPPYFAPYPYWGPSVAVIYGPRFYRGRGVYFRSHGRRW